MKPKNTEDLEEKIIRENVSMLTSRKFLDIVEAKKTDKYGMHVVVNAYTNDCAQIINFSNSPDEKPYHRIGFTVETSNNRIKYLSFDGELPPGHEIIEKSVQKANLLNSSRTN